jgi:hypothetical protein
MWQVLPYVSASTWFPGRVGLVRVDRLTDLRPDIWIGPEFSEVSPPTFRRWVLESRN